MPRNVFNPEKHVHEWKVAAEARLTLNGTITAHGATIREAAENLVKKLTKELDFLA